MKPDTFRTLLRSFEKLERALDTAEDAAIAKDSEDVRRRLRSYRESLQKQKTLAESLEAYLSCGNMSEVSRHISLIRQHSSMIRDDARDIVSLTSSNPPKLERVSSELH